MAWPTEQNRFVAHIGAGAAGGMFGLGLVGLIEALVVLGQGQFGGDIGALPFALAVYGLFGALGGAGLGFAMGLVMRARPGAFAAYCAVFFWLGAAVIGRFRVIRDVFDERLPPGLLALLGQVAALLLLALVAFGIFRAARRLGGTALGRPVGAVLTLVIAVALTAGVNMVTGASEVSLSTPSKAGPADAPPIILIMVDTLRADRLSSYGYTDGSTPHIDKLAADGIRFTKAVAQASWTRPSVATILTSLYPSSHGAVHKGDILSDSVETVAEALQAHGYDTIGLPNNVNVTEAFNFQQGFDDYIYLAPDLFFFASESAAELLVYSQLRLVRERFLSRTKWVRNYYQPAEVVTDRALEILGKRRDRPFFLYLHYMDPHDPYFAHPFDGHGVARVAMPNPPAAEAASLSDLYDGEIAYMDEHLGRLFAGLREMGLYDRSLIVLTADHGEEFYEHEGWWHGTTLYDEQILIPLIVKAPGRVGAGRVADAFARSLDVAPTMLAVAGAPVPGEMQGRVLTFRAPDDGGPSSVFAENELEGNVLRAVRTKDWKLILANEGNPRGQPPNQLFNIVVDGGERNNLFGTNRAEEAELAGTLDRLSGEARQHARAAEKREVDSATHERLKALGYVD